MTCASWKATWSRVLCGAACVRPRSHARARPPSARSSQHLQMPARQATRPARPDSATVACAERYILIMPEVGPEPDAAPPKVSQDIAAMRIDPENSVLVVQRGQSATLSFRAFATMKAGGDEVEITARTVFYVPDNYLVGEFPADGSSIFIDLPADQFD